MKISLGSSNFLEGISSLSHFIVFLYFFVLISWGRLSYLSLLFFGTLHSNGCIFPFLLCLSLLFFSQLFVRPPPTTILPFCISFSWGWSWSLPHAQCHKPSSIVLQALSLSDPISWICLSLPPYNRKGFDLGHTWMDSLEKTLMLGGIGGRRRRGQQMMRWLDGIWWTWVWVNSGSWWWTGGLTCCDSWGCKELDTTQRLNWTEWSSDFSLLSSI